MIFLPGYDPDANPPKYDAADKSVIDNTESIRKNFLHWDKVADTVLKTLPEPTGQPPGMVPQ